MVLAGLLFGFVVGVGLIAGWKYIMDKRSKHRIQKVTCLMYSLYEKCSSCFSLRVVSCWCMLCCMKSMFDLTRLRKK